MVVCQRTLMLPVCLLSASFPLVLSEIPSLFGLFNNRCNDDSEERCLFGLGFIMYAAEGSACANECILFPTFRPALECGVCPDPLTSNDPVSTPTIDSSSYPLTTPSAAPYGAPSATPSIFSADTSKYDISLEFNDIPQGDQEFFQNASRRWEQIIIGDLDARSPNSFLPSLPEGCSYPFSIDDLYICVMYREFDGAGGILASTQPLWIRSSQNLPVAGLIQIDSADIVGLKRHGILYDVILHEIGHVLGFGTSPWERANLVGPDSDGCSYLAGNATREYQAVANCTSDDVSPPIQQTDPGACRHWSESCLGNELMTSVVASVNVTKNPLSRMTVGVLHDLGYTVNYTAADAHSLDDLTCDPCAAQPDRRWLQRGSSAPDDRDISDAARQSAFEYGEQLLRESVLIRHNIGIVNPATTTDSSIMDVEYVGDKSTAILAMEDNTIFSVVVTN